MTNKAGMRRKQNRKLRRLERRELLRDAARINQGEVDGLRSTAAPSTLVESGSDLSYRASPIGTVNEDERTVIATLTTEQPVPMYDYRTGRGVIDEVLVARGGKFPETMVMLDDHNRFGGSRSVTGSIRGMKLDGDRWRGTLHFARNAGSHIDEIWELVRQKHLTDVSLGYRYGDKDFVDIPAGRTMTVDGKDYTAGTRTLRVVTSWSAREGSTTPIGADDQAKIGRAESLFGGTPPANPANSNADTGASSQTASDPIQARNKGSETMKFLQWLQARGMSADITEQAAALAWAKRNLAGDLLVEFTGICRAENIQFDVGTTPVGQPNTQPPNATATTLVATEPVRTETTTDQYRTETERIGYIRQMAEALGVGADLVRQAITERWDVARVNTTFAAPEVRQERSAPLAPAIHTRQSGLNLRTLQAAMLLRAGVEIDNPMLRTNEATHVLNSREAFGARADGQPVQNAAWLANYSRSLQAGGATTDEESARAVDDAWAYRSMSLVDVCRAAMDVEGVRHNSYDRDEIVQRAFSTATLQAVFTTNFAAQMLEGFATAPDTTGPWTRSADLPNFMTVERIQKHLTSGLKRTDRNQTPEDAEQSAVMESYKLARYTERFTVDEMDIIDDRFGALDMTPGEFGEAARELRPDLVYSLLLSNPTMGQDNKALFHADHGNLVASGAGLSVSTLEARKSAMATQTSNGRLLNVMARYLLVPESKAWTADTIVGSAERRNTTTSIEYGTMNPARGAFQVISEPRLDTGVTDPSGLTGAVNAGQPGAWFLATANGRHGIEVGYLRGSGRAPIVRRYNLTEGRIGMGWLVIMYVAAKAIGYQGLQKASA